ncbi:MAG: 4-(cytidine 5'-diphospho)-2-C-methyl-D-erythritol kinase [Acidimicrobiales bacterium]
MIARVSLSARAKLTLSLRVTGVRPDGYHLLDTEMVSIDLADTLEITESPRIEISVENAFVGGIAADSVPTGDSNLVARALALLGVTAHVRLVKRIPPGAGLGGGSSDAAAILRWARETDPDLAARLGADVPFCVRGGRARVSGIGEVVEPLGYEDQRFLLLFPPLAVSTVSVYRAWDERAAAGVVDDESEGGSANDLEAAAFEVEPNLARWRNCFWEASERRPSLAGSGSVWFVEGEPADLGLEGRTHLVLGSERARLVAVRTAPPDPG